MKLPILADVETFIERHLSRSIVLDVFVMQWGKAWRLSVHTRRPGALLIGRFNSLILPTDLLDAAIEAIQQAKE